jgi:hypothetical protein
MANNIVYSFLDVNAALVGPGGFVNLGNSAGVSEEGISIEPTGDINTMTIGADGAGMHSLHGDKSGKVTVRLLKTSPTNKLLMALYNFQTSSAANHGQNTITIVDSARGDTITCRQCAFAKATGITYAKDAGMNEWAFDAVAIDRTLG